MSLAGFGTAMAHSVRTTVLHRAAVLLGGAARLRELLDASPETFEAWFTGALEPPEHAFLRALDVILDDLDQRYET